MVYAQTLARRAVKNASTKALKQFNVYDIIISPVITEKSMQEAELNNVYTFKIHDRANKNDVKAAIAHIYGVTPKSVNVANIPFKGRANRSKVRQGYKKAVVTLKKGDTITFGA